MPRNSSGTYSAPTGQPVVSGTVVSAATHNTLVSDIASELTSSLDRAGRGAMQAPVRVPNGSVSAPTLTFADQTNTGLYRAGASDVRLTVNGTDQLKVTATGVEVVGDLTVTGIGSVPAGVVLPFAGSVAPAGFLLCNGAAVSRATYAALFAVVGTTYGVGDGSTTFNVPDTRSRSVVGAGQGSGLTNRALAATGGEETHQLTTAELASHNHTASSGNQSADHSHSDSGHTHPNYSTTSGHAAGAGGAQVPDMFSEYVNTSIGYASLGNQSANHNHAITVNSNGSGTAHNNMHPFLALNHIIRY